MRELLEAVLLGVVQGLTEFIPISSSGHLVLVPELLGLRQLDQSGVAFEVALHLGTFFAVVIFFRDELLALVRAVFGRGDPVFVAYYRRIATLIVVGSVPIAVIGLLLRDVFEAAFDSPTAAAVFLLVTGGLLLFGEAVRTRRGGIRAATPATDEDALIGVDPADPEGLSLDQIGVRQALVIGFGQCIALFPGISRSGTTIVAGMTAGLTRPAATRFSFLLALPALIGATVVSLPDLSTDGSSYGLVAIAAGVVAAFVSGYFAIRWLLALVARDRLTVFAIYCLVVGAGSLAVLQLR